LQDLTLQSDFFGTRGFEKSFRQEVDVGGVDGDIEFQNPSA
jgi:hypothetical protein